MSDHPAPIGQSLEAVPNRCVNDGPGDNPGGGQAHYVEPAGFREYVIGVSVIYPVLEYKARTNFSVERKWNENDVDEQYWNVLIEPNAPQCAPDQYNEPSSNPGCADDTKAYYPVAGLIPAGESRTITIQIRVYRPFTWYDDHLNGQFAHPGDYLRLFREYRRYFKQTYGDVRYTRDTRPIRRIPLFGIGCFDTANTTCPTSPPSATSCQSRFGFTSSHDWSRLVDPDPQDSAPDGWEYYTTIDPQNPRQGVIERFRQEGFQRVMLSNPSGYYCPDGSTTHIFNMPFAIQDRWDWIAQLTAQPNWQNHPVLSTRSMLGAWQSNASIDELAYRGERELSLWWGRSSLPSSAVALGDSLYAYNQVLLDRCSGSSSRLKAEEQLLGMAETGAAMIGLDFMSKLPEWDTYFWLQDMLKLCDDAGTNIAKFGTEAYHSDFNHTIAPTYFQLYKSTTVNPPRGPHGMRDFLNQYAESWGVVSGGHQNIMHDEAAMQCAMRLVAQWGFTPKIIMNNPIDIREYVFNGSTFEPGPGIDPQYEAADSWLDTVPPDLIEP